MIRDRDRDRLWLRQRTRSFFFWDLTIIIPSHLWLNRTTFWRNRSRIDLFASIIVTENCKFQLFSSDSFLFVHICTPIDKRRSFFVQVLDFVLKIGTFFCRFSTRASLDCDKENLGGFRLRFEFWFYWCEWALLDGDTNLGFMFARGVLILLVRTLSTSAFLETRTPFLPNNTVTANCKFLLFSWTFYFDSFLCVHIYTPVDKRRIFFLCVQVLKLW